MDIDHGTYPFVTSSNTVSAAACIGTGVGPTHITHVIGIVKAYLTRVGSGPFATEIHGDDAERLRTLGREFGVTRERIRQIEAKALRKLRHPSRSKKLKDFMSGK